MEWHSDRLVSSNSVDSFMLIMLNDNLDGKVGNELAELFMEAGKQ